MQKKMNSKLFTMQLNPAQVRKLFNPRSREEEMNRTEARLVVLTLERFCSSDDAELADRHVPNQQVLTRTHPCICTPTHVYARA